MQTLLILLGSLAAILALFGLNIWVLGWRRQAIASEQAALEALQADYIGFQPGRLWLSDDGRAALVEDRASGRTGVCFAMGDDIATRLLTPADIRKVDVNGSGNLSLQLTDFTLPRVLLSGDDENNARQWARLLEGNDEQGHA